MAMHEPTSEMCEAMKRMVKLMVETESKTMPERLAVFVQDSVFNHLDDMMGLSLMSLLEQVQKQKYHQPDSDSREYCVGCGESPYRKHEQGCMVSELAALLKRVHNHVSGEDENAEIRAAVLAKLTPRELAAFASMIKLS